MSEGICAFSLRNKFISWARGAGPFVPEGKTRYVKIAWPKKETRAIMVLRANKIRDLALSVLNGDALDFIEDETVKRIREQIIETSNIEDPEASLIAKVLSHGGYVEVFV